MIVYKATDWWEALRHLSASGVIRQLLKRVLFIGLYAALITGGASEFERLKVPIDREFFTFLGIMLSLLMAFRTNTAYDRFYEGRRVWGQLVNNCRNLAIVVGARLPADDNATRTYFARLLSSFPIALDGHLRTGVRFEKLEEAEPGFVARLKTVDHVPARIAALVQEFFERLLAQGVILPEHLITFQRHHEALLDVAGACERIKGTPIPFSYSFFIKGFISVFILIMPFNLLDTYHWLTVPITMFGAYALLGVEMIGDEIENPFGKDSNDLPLTQLSNRIRANVHEIMHVALDEDVKALADMPYSVVF
ncbi:MAG: hypothetical protein M3Y54_02430 [Bacteroidota bacterium]|nr:hypothetical protein [Bacteroidota bacterium]